jgi:hypothetical protein
LVALAANTPVSVNGLDDLLALEGAERIRELIQAAKPYRESAPGTHVYSYAERLRAAQSRGKKLGSRTMDPATLYRLVEGYLQQLPRRR